jgi:ATP-binding cassette, subfamily B, bacterial
LHFLTTYLRPEWPRLLLLAALLFAGIGLQLANPQIARTFIDQAQAGEPLDRLIGLAVLFIGVVLLTQAATVAETYVAENLGWRTTNALRADLTRHVLDLDDSFHAEHTPGELIERIDGDVATISDFFARFVVQVLGGAVFLLGVLALLIREDWRVGGLLTLCALVAFVFMTRGGGFVGFRSRLARESAAELSSYVEERLAALPDIKANGADDYAMRGLYERLRARFRTVCSSVMAGELFNVAVALLFVFGTAAALGLSVTLLSAGAMTLGGVFLVFRYTGMLQPPLQRLSRQMNQFQQATGGIVRVKQLLATAPRVVDGPLTRMPSGALLVELDRVSFAYETEPVLRNVSCRVEPGEVLGLLGRTGSGKTTLARLLFRLHDATDGTVRLGGMEIRTVRLDVLRQRVALVTQDVQLFQGTLRDNVAVFDPNVADDRLGEVFKELGLEEWLGRMPAGLDTQLGPSGRGLSAGEAQLVAFARVFLKDPGLVVLDEASSRLDPETERLLERAMQRLLAGRSGVVIAHRLATVERADRILILEGGCVAEAGRRVDLAADPASRFARLLRMGQAEELA